MVQAHMKESFLIHFLPCFWVFQEMLKLYEV